ncbi:phospholipid carrier-dependent glycosyltransferase [filamentous cyanobacterium LEGE 07170]|nr:phospholipid carrier-dependent glycosyltransferase [filamentous cyanobacterium LEGE 07170]
MLSGSAQGKGKVPWFSAGLVGLFAIALLLRLWGLERFNTLVFDEVYYANFAVAFLNRQQEFGGHPPLSHYLIAFSIWIGEWLNLGDEASRNTLTGVPLATISYRWLNAWVGALYPVIVGALAFQLTRRRSYGLLAALLATADGMFLVESRYALNNIYLVLFGLLGHLFFLMALHTLQQRLRAIAQLAAQTNAMSSTLLENDARLPTDLPKAIQRYTWQLWLWLVLAGVGFGGAIAIKWNGAGFWLGMLILWALAWGRRLLRYLGLEREPNVAPPSVSPLVALTRLHGGHLLIVFGVVPAITYWLSWLPHMALSPMNSFWQWQIQVLDYHQRVGGIEAHPYCSPWWSWLFMLRPIAYFYETWQQGQSPPAVLANVAPSHLPEAIYDVHAMGNPVLWWLSAVGILALVAIVGIRFWQSTRQPFELPALGDRTVPTMTRLRVAPQGWHLWTLLFLTVNWATNWLPWVPVTRCTFLYHYMGASVFALLAIALWLEWGLRSGRPVFVQLSLTVILLILLAFLFWLPFFLGLPLSPTGIQIRRWFDGWV